MEYRFIVTGGGTAGHINPAITIADALKRYYEAKGDTCSIVFTGREIGLEGKLVPKAGYKLINIEAKPFPMKPSPKLVRAAVALKKGRKQCRELIDEIKPHAVIGTGGYVCAPLLMEAEKRDIPVIIHEANAFPGRANRMLGKKADVVLTGFPGQEKDFEGAGKVIHTGNPIRSIMFGNSYEEARKKLGIEPDQKLVFAMGGSLGARTINDFILEAAARPEFSDVRFVLSSGMQQSGSLDKDRELPSNLEIKQYIDNPNDYLAGADVSITRAGAVTCAETAAVGSCSIFIPYPNAAHDHQTYNASAFEKVGGCRMMSDHDVCEGKLFALLSELLSDREAREEIRKNAHKLEVADCDERICNAIDSVIRK